MTLNEKLQLADSVNAMREKELYASKAEIDQLKDETNRLREAIINKDNRNQILEMSVEKERERRQSETNELRRLFDKEQDRAVFAIREAEKSSTRVESFQMQAEKAE